MSPHELAADLLAERGIRPHSIIGGTRMQSLIAEAVMRDRAQRADIPRVIHFVEGDWDLDFDEDSGDEAWWIELQLLDPETASSTVRPHLAVLCVSDVEAAGLRDALDQIITEGRRRFR